MKNPFRTRFALESQRLLPKYLEIEDSTRWCVIYRKWWQRKWHYAEMEYTGFSNIKIPKYYDSKEAAIESVTRININ